MEEHKCTRPENNVGFLLKELSNRMEMNRNKNVKHMELTASQFEVLIFLHINEDKVVYQTDIESGLNRSNPTITGIINRLEAKGFVERIPNPKDRRYKQIVLTDKARKMHEQGEKNREEGERNLTRNLKPEETERLKEYLRILLATVEEDLKEDVHA